MFFHSFFALFKSIKNIFATKKKPPCYTKKTPILPPSLSMKNKED